MSARRLAWIALAVVVAGALAVLVARSRPDESPAARARRLPRELACPVCDGQSVAESNAPEARAMRADIRDRIAAGESDAAIRAAYVRTYGEHVLLRPANRGIALLAWTLPASTLLLGGAALVVALRRWARMPRLAATADDEDIVRDAREHADENGDEGGERW